MGTRAVDDESVVRASLVASGGDACRATSRLSNAITTETAALALTDLVRLPVALFPFTALADRVWELRRAVTPHDAWYVSVAELLGVPLVTLDRRLAAAPGTHCTFVLPPTTNR